MSVVLTAREGRDSITTFERPRLILVEGSDDRAVIASLIDHEKLPADDFHIHNMIGKDNWGKALKALMLVDGFENVLSLGLVRDADADPAATWRSCQGTLSSVGLPVPSRPDEFAAGRPSVTVTIVPSSSTSGALEELCWETFNQSQRACVDSYFDCLNHPPDIRAKELVQVYLAGLDRPCRDLRVAAERHDLELSHPGFDSLRRFLRLLA